MRLTLGMATHTDYHGAFFTLQSAAVHHRGQVDELLVVDNTPKGHTHQVLLEQLCRNMNCRALPVRYVPSTASGTAAPRNLVFDEASCELVCCVDSHVLVHPAGLLEIKSYFDNDQHHAPDLVQGPVMSDDGVTVTGTHLDPVWGEDGMHGKWQVAELEPPYQIPMQGLGLFAARKDKWPRFHDAFTGFGGEEGYIHYKVQQRGGRTVSLPGLKWQHRWQTPGGKPWKVQPWQMPANYIIGRLDLGCRFDDVLKAWERLVPPGQLQNALDAAASVFGDDRVADPTRGDAFTLLPPSEKNRV